MCNEKVPETEILERMKTLQGEMEKKNLPEILITQMMDLYYFTGSMFNGLLYVSQEKEPLLLVKKSLTRTQEESSLGKILPFKSLKALPQILKEQGYQAPKTLGLTMDNLPANTYRAIQDLFPETHLMDISFLIRKIRMIKSNYELGLHKKAGVISEKGFLALFNMIKEGREELEVAIELETFLRQEGHQGLIRARSPYLELFYGQICSGKNSASFSYFDGPVVGKGLNPAIPHGSGRKKIVPHEPIVADYCSQLEGYLIDETRVFFIGELPSHLARAYSLALDLQALVLEKATPGTSTRHLYEEVLKRVRDEDLEENFMGYGQERSRFIAHGVGLELDEFPVITSGLDFPLQEGMVLALEPKFVFPLEGAVGIESTYYMGKEKLERFTQTPDDPSFFNLG